ncbi:MAG TPA: single-stranded DNA-binding protein [bacterium]|jgi:single-strand DNA-binding protein|nr:single-stranded DNA-binding protein [bacterium]
MASLNRVFVVGNLTKDPELRFIPTGQAVANMRLATNRKYKSLSGEWKDEVTYVGVEAWGKPAEACAEYLKKGSPVMVEGRLKLKEWTAQDGQKRSLLEVVAERVQFLTGGPRQEASLGGEDAGGHESDGPLPPGDDDIPF